MPDDYIWKFCNKLLDNILSIIQKFAKSKNILIWVSKTYYILKPATEIPTSYQKVQAG